MELARTIALAAGGNVRVEPPAAGEQRVLIELPSGEMVDAQEDPDR
jgi:hypothetical protein